MSSRSLFAVFGPGLLSSALALLALTAVSHPASRADDVDPEPPSRYPETTDQDRTRSANNLKMIGLAMHNYHDANGTFPSAAPYQDNNGKALLSWRVALLPYVEEDGLYRQFRFNEPWDSKHNKTLLEKMPSIYAPTIKGKPARPNTTYYQAFTGNDAPFDPKAKRGPQIAGIKDGVSTTAMVVEGGEAVPWTKPEDVAYDAKKKLPKLGGLFAEGFHVAFFDGSVRLVDRKAKTELLRAMITPAGGERLNGDDLLIPKKK